MSMPILPSHSIYDLNRATPLPASALFDTREEGTRIEAALRAALTRAGIIPAQLSSPLEELHLHIHEDVFLTTPGGRIEHDETMLMAVLRDFAGSGAFQAIYLDLIRKLQTRVFDFDFVFERIPVVRCVAPQRLNLQPLRLPDGRLMAYHTDMLYSDPCGQINCWLPLTANENSASLQMCSLDISLALLREYFGGKQSLDCIPEGSRTKFFQFISDDKDRPDAILHDSRPLNVPSGMTHFFDMRRLHATADNQEDTTRFSMDFRLVPIDVYGLLAARGSHAPCYAGSALLRSDFYHALQASQLAAK